MRPERLAELVANGAEHQSNVLPTTRKPSRFLSFKNIETFPKFGFKNINRVEYKGINLDALQTLADTKKVKEITPAILHENGLVAKKDLVKITNSISK